MFLVTGATGSLGRRVVRVLTARQAPVRAFVRLSSDYSELENRGADIFIGDLKRERDIQKACDGVKYIISTHGGKESGGAQAIDYRANIDLIDYGKAAGVEHFVLISVLGCDRGYMDSPVFKAKREVEKYLEKSGLTYTILRPSAFDSALIPFAQRFKETGVYLSLGDLRNRTSPVSTDDLAQIAADSVLVPEAANKIFPVGGPEILSREEIPQIFGRIFNRDPMIINPPIMVLDGVRNALGLVNPCLQKSLGTLRVLVSNEFFCTAEEIATLESVFGIKMESLDSFIRRYVSG
ncbi:SDR family oxidoreductase [Laspinema olomoucense]|uniref:SDR family oxidoreductase n=1 Tax=Laspinema olomoucense D3b TaxID=2953688 RepID=A0ABT2N9T3_9CYAN|nr:SDR family oxidoreductase [Laspinema sp. D3b]MCT7979463.1 SDR family oxidoreductase [Laspinema sp. D3b]